MAEQTTSVQNIEADIDALLAQPGAESVMTPEKKNEEAKPNLFSRKDVDLKFLDTNLQNQTTGNEEDEEKKKAAAEAARKKLEEEQEAIDSIKHLGSPGEEDTNAPGRKKTSKEGLVELTKKLIEKKMIVPFEDDKALEEYTLQDFEELFEANDKNRRDELEEEVPKRFIASLPDKLKYAAKYVQDGGTDLTGLFSALAESERVEQLDTSEEAGAEAIVRQYLQATNFGDDNEIQEEIDSWKDRGELEAKADKFKPKLNSLKEQSIQYKLRQQEQLRNQQQERAKEYMKDVYELLEPGSLNGIKLDKKTQGLIYSGLTQANYQSVSQRPTNLLGHLLEKYQFVEPRHDLIAEVLWHLADPEGFKAKIKEAGSTAANIETARRLKTAQASKTVSSSEEEEETQGKTKGLKRPGPGFFKR